MTEEFIGFERQENEWAILFKQIADDHKQMAYDWAADHSNYEMALRCSIIAETYANVASQLTKSRRIRLEDKGW